MSGLRQFPTLDRFDHLPRERAQDQRRSLHRSVRHHVPDRLGFHRNQAQELAVGAVHFNIDPTVARSLRREEERQPLGVVVDWNLQHEVRLPVDREVGRDDADAKPRWKCLAGLRVGVVDDFHRFSRPLDSRWLATRGPVFQAE